MTVHDGRENFGRYYEEFEVGDVFKHWPGRTITEYDDVLHCMQTMNHHPLHIDARYAAEETQFGKNVVVGTLVYSIIFGMTVTEISGKAIANLEIESLKHTAPTFHGDTVYAETTVTDKVESRSRNDSRHRHGRHARLQPARRDRPHVHPQGHGPQARAGRLAGC